MASGVAHANVSVGAAVVPPALAPPLIYQQLVNAGLGGIAGNSEKLGQNIKVPGAGTTFKWSIDLQKTGSPTGNIKAVLYNTDAFNKPTTAIANSAQTFDVSLFPTSVTGTLSQIFSWSGLTLTAGVLYAVAFESDGTLALSGGFIHMAREAHSNTGILDSAEVYYNGTSWSEVPFWDMYGEMEVT